MIAGSIAAGIRGAARRLGVAALMWAWVGGLGLVAVTPLWRWLRTATALSPETDVLRHGLSVGALTDLLTGSPDMMPTFIFVSFSLMVVAFLSNAFVGGAVLALVVSDADDRPLVMRFFAGGGRFFGRFLRLLALFGLSAVLVAGSAAALIGAATKSMSEGGWEPGSIVATAITLSVVGVVVGFFVLALDYARIRVALSDERGMTRAWMGGIRFVLRHPLGAVVIGVLAMLAWAACVVAAQAAPLVMGGESRGLIAGGLLLAEVALWLRAVVRVGQVSAEAHFFEGLWIAPAAAAVGPTAEVERTPEPLLVSIEEPVAPVGAGTATREDAPDRVTFGGEVRREDM